MDEVIKESDLIQLDGTIDKLIEQLVELNAAYGTTVEVVKKKAGDLRISLKAASGASNEGRKAIDDAAVAAARYERALKELDFALSETGKQVAILKAETRDVNKATVAQHRQIESAIGSYDKIKEDVKELTALYKSLSAAERADAEFGEQVIAELKAKNTELVKLEKAIKPTIEQVTRLQRAEQELAYWQSDEGQKLLEVKKQIREVTAARKETKAAVDPLTVAQEKYSKALNNEAQRIRELNFQTKQINTERDLEAKVNATVAGSYNRLSAEYELAKFRLKNMSGATAEGRQEIEETQDALRRMYAEMRQFQEATGVYSLGVGDYAQSWGGLGYSVQQVVRELPAATVSLNTFFLAISNNIPILVDEINRTRLANKQMLAEGKQTVPVTKQIVSALFSWQTALVIVLTTLSQYGGAIADWIGSLFKSEKTVKGLAKVLGELSDEIITTNGDYGKNMVTIRKLADEYKELNSELEKTEWIENNRSMWEELNVAIYDAADAERFFIERSSQVVEAFEQRARAAAAYKLVQDNFEKILGLEYAIETFNRDYGDGGFFVDYLERSIDEIKQEIDLLFDIADIAETAANTEIGEYDDGTGKNRGGRDFTKYIESTKVKVTKESEEAITKLQISEFAKRRKAALATYNEEVGQLQNTYNENTRILEGYYELRKPLTEPQRKDLKESNKQILETLDTYKLAYDKTKNDIAKDEKIATAKRQQELIQLRLDAVKKGSDEEYSLKMQAINKQRELDKLQNSKLAENEQQDETAIDAKYNKQLEDLEAEKSLAKLKIIRENIALQLEAVKEGSNAEYELRKSDIETQMKMEIAENSRLAEEEQLSEEAIKAKYNKQLEDLEAEHQAALLDITLAGIELRLDAAKKGSGEELELVLQQIEQERLAAIEANKRLAKELQQSEEDINAYYARRSSYAQGNYELSAFRVKQTISKIDIVSKPGIKYGEEGSRRREVYEIQQNILDIEKQINLAEASRLDLTEEQLVNLKLQKIELEKQKKEIAGFSGFISDVADNGIAGGILGALGFDDEAIDAFEQSVNVVIENLNAIAEAEIEAAESAAEAAKERVDAYQKAYDAEIEARNNGYANNVETARKELEEERKNQAEKERILLEAQKRQEQLNTITQTSSLITAAAQIWKAMSSYGILGPSLAVAAIATMFGSFIAAKVKANQVASQAYGEGGLEFLEGGSHASGNDIDLGINNSRNRRMRAEGGEAIAIINKRNTKRYKDVLPSVIESFNNGTFHDKYVNAFSIPDEQHVSINQSSAIDLSAIEDDVRNIRKNNETRYYVMPDGSIITTYKNIKRIIRKS